MRTHVIFLLSVSTFACGSSGGSANPTSGGPTPGNPAGAHNASDASAGDARADGAASAEVPAESCCVAGEYFVCGSSEAVSRCSGFDLSSCLRGCGVTDESCARRCGESASKAPTDSSGCTRDPSHDALCPKPSGKNGSTSSHTSSSSNSGSGSGGSGGGSLPTPKNACGGGFTGYDCDPFGQCTAGGHCTGGKCYPNDVANPCTFPTDCGSNHCVNGCCTSGGPGSACGTGMDCASNSCSNSVCQ